jgi:DDE superfamily endonuclease
MKKESPMLDAIVNRVKQFREKIYRFFPLRRDAAMELVDSLASNTQAKSVVELSLNPLHRRNYCSITRCIDEFYAGLSQENKQQQNKQLTQILSDCCSPLQKRPYHLFAVDCTSNPRIFSNTLSDRGIVHAPNPIYNNLPITIGHQYSMAVYLPEKLSEDTPPWVVPLSCERVSTEQKGTVVGMEQISHCISHAVFKGTLCVSVGDCAYSDSSSISQANKNPEQVHVSRAKNNRVFYNALPDKKRKSRGRPKRYGKKFRLNAKRLSIADESTELKITSTKGKEFIVTIECWNNMRMRGKKGCDTSKTPLRLLRIRVHDATGELLFKRPMWLIVSGKRQNELSLIDVYHIYHHRFDIEHFFKFGKNRLLMNKTQTPEVDHEEAWWQFTMMAYAQLYVCRALADYMPTPWEKYLEEFKSTDREKSPTQVQKSFYRIIRGIGTPAQAPKPRNKSIGRVKGTIQIKRQRHPVIIKSKNTLIRDVMTT